MKSTYIWETLRYNFELLLLIRNLLLALFPVKFGAVLKDAWKLNHPAFLSYLTQLCYRQAKTNCPFMLIKESDISFPILSICS